MSLAPLPAVFPPNERTTTGRGGLGMECNGQICNGEERHQWKKRKTTTEKGNTKVPDKCKSYFVEYRSRRTTFLFPKDKQKGQRSISK